MALDVVVLRALGLGDLLTVVPALRALQDLGGAVTVAAPAPLAPLVGLAGCRHLPAQPLRHLPAEAYGARLLANLHGRGPQSHVIALATHPERLVAFHHPAIPETGAFPEWREDEHEVARWCRLLSEHGIPADPARLALPLPSLPPRLAHARGATVIHPGAASGARRWPPDRYAAVAAALDDRVVVTGGTRERHLAERVAASAGLRPGAVLAGETDLLELAAVVAHAGRVICGDTGVAHLATAFGVPSIVLFGPTPPSRWGPPPGETHQVLWTGRPGDPHAEQAHHGLLDITVADVLAALDPEPLRSPT